MPEPIDKDSAKVDSTVLVKPNTNTKLPVKASDYANSSSSSSSLNRKRSRMFLPSSDDEGSKFGNIIKEGQVVILYAGHSSISIVKLEAGARLGHRHGVYLHDQIIGLKFGDMIVPNQSNTSTKKRKQRNRAEVVTGGYATLLPVTPELWARGIDTRTQITFSLDNCMIASHLHLRPGQTVCESGTGSGALTTFLARTVGAKGRVCTFEFNKERFLSAQKEFKLLELGCVESNHADVYKDGFGVNLDNQADAVFLDLPNPWLALPHAAKALKSLGRICTFSPCIEQVQRSASMMSRMGFSHINTCTATLMELRSVQAKTLAPDLFLDSVSKFRAERGLADPKYAIDSPEGKKIKAQDESANKPSSHESDVEGEEEDVLGFNNAGTPVYPPHATFRNAAALKQVITPCTTRYDRIKTHTGYLTFAYAPLK